MTKAFTDGPPLLYFAVGRGKAAKKRFSLATLEKITAEMQRLPKEISLKYQSRALKKAAKPGQDALRRTVSGIGQVTGNLLASVTQLDRKYTNNKAGLPVSVVVVGFRRPTNAKSQKSATPAFQGGSVLKGPNRAYHSHLVEYGTKPRVAGVSSRVKKRRRVILGGRIRTIVEREQRDTLAAGGRRILSSFKSRGPFTGRGLYPVDFIATGTVRGAPAQHPLQKAFNQSKSTMQSILDVEMRKALTAAVRQIGRDIRKSGGE